MEDFIKNIAAQEGWTDATLVSVLAGVLDDIAERSMRGEDSGQGEIEALILERTYG